MNAAPQIRIIVRYVVGMVLGALATRYVILGPLAEPQVIEAVTTAIVFVLNEAWYAHDKRTGGPT